MNSNAKRTLVSFSIEVVVYTAFVVAYFFLVLHFLGGWLLDLEKHRITTYGAVCLGLIIGQAVVLEGVTTGLLRILRGRSE